MARRLTFTTQREPIELELGGEMFTAPPVIPATNLGELVDKHTAIAAIDIGQLGGRDALDQMLNVLAELFELILDPDSGQRFRARLFSREQPFDLQREVLPAITALVEEYTGRPTEPSSASSNGSTASGGGSTDGALPAESTPSTLMADASAT